MNVSELISMLQEMEADHGDLRVFVQTTEGEKFFDMFGVGWSNDDDGIAVIVRM